MINDFNINIFNYIFSINADIKEGVKEDKEEYRKKLNNIIEKTFVLEDFWNEYKYYFNDKCVLMANVLDGTIVRYNNFPRMKSDMKKIFLDYKSKQIEGTIYNNGDLIENELKNIFTNIENLGRKIILDYCKNKGLIKYNGRVFIAADDNPACAIVYDNIEAVIYNNEKQSGLFSQNIIQNINYGDNYGIFNQSNSIKNNDEKLFETVLEKLEVMKLESKISNEKLEDIREACNKKEKSKVTNFLKEIAMGTGTNLIASGILGMFGLM